MRHVTLFCQTGPPVLHRRTVEVDDNETADDIQSRLEEFACDEIGPSLAFEFDVWWEESE